MTLGKVGFSIYKDFKEKQQKAADDHYNECVLQMATTGEAIATALIAASTGQEATSPGVRWILEEELGTSQFQARAHRLFKEMLSSPSRTRRQRLAAVLLGRTVLCAGAR